MVDAVVGGSGSGSDSGSGRNFLARSYVVLALLQMFVLVLVLVASDVLVVLFSCFAPLRGERTASTRIRAGSVVVEEEEEVVVSFLLLVNICLWADSGRLRPCACARVPSLFALLQSSVRKEQLLATPLARQVFCPQLRRVDMNDTQARLALLSDFP